jgi:hypothetical protein
MRSIITITTRAAIGIAALGTVTAIGLGAAVARPTGTFGATLVHSAAGAVHGPAIAPGNGPVPPLGQHGLPTAAAIKKVALNNQNHHFLAVRCSGALAVDSMVLTYFGDQPDAFVTITCQGATGSSPIGLSVYTLGYDGSVRLLDSPYQGNETYRGYHLLLHSPAPVITDYRTGTGYVRLSGYGPDDPTARPSKQFQQSLRWNGNGTSKGAIHAI